MDVELLRPGTVPISPDTVLWFEFLLDPDLLLKHLQKQSPDPTPAELITKFYDVISETVKIRPEVETGEIINIESNGDKPKHPAKSAALKILSLKIAAFLKWNLELIRSLPFKTQINLLQDLMFFTNNKNMVEIPDVERPEIHLLSPQYLFVLVLYHRWLLKTSMHRVTSNWQLRFSINDMSPIDANIICSSDNIKKSITFLTDSLAWEIVPEMLTFECFNLPTEANDSVEFQWTKSQSISKNEFGAQINYDLGTFFFYQEDYDLAKKHFSDCLQCFMNMQKFNEFYDVDRHMLEVYINACHGSQELKGNLLEQLNSSIVNQYMGITTILQQDNIYKEIPLVHRLNLELDIQGALSSGAFTVARDLLFKIKALNIVRTILDKKPLYQYAYFSVKNTEIFIWAFQITWKSFSQIDKQLLKSYLLELILRGDCPELLPKIQSTEEFEVFDNLDLQYIKGSESKFNIPDSLNRNDLNILEFNRKRMPKMELRQLEQQLIATYDHKEIREILVKIAVIKLGTTVWSINPQWELPIPLQSVLKTLPRGFHQDYAYVTLAKSKEQLLNKNWNLTMELLLILDKELHAANCNVPKLFKLISWEILLVQITQLVDEWPKHTIDKHALANACEVCLQANDTVLPRTEIVEQCAVYLLNLGRWDFLINYEKRRTTFEITSAIALACQEIVKQKGNKKLSKNLWDLVLPIFATSQTKRSSSGYHDVSNLRSNLISIFSKLKDSWCLVVVLSLLTRLFNILKDESSIELQVDYANLWPAVVSNANSYNALAVSELLSEIVTQALKDYPTNVSWLRLMGDINFANGHYRASLNYYLKSLLIFNDYFNIPVRNDDHVFRRMIKCCTSLGCFTQAAVLCQFLEETDYSLAFRILADQKTSNDAVDAYYHCFWETSILEYLIQLHNKKGEFQRRKCAIQVIGMLELNSNNNEEIQREASNLRKSTFLRALCKQYVF